MQAQAGDDFYHLRRRFTISTKALWSLSHLSRMIVLSTVRFFSRPSASSRATLCVARKCYSHLSRWLPAGIWCWSTRVRLLSLLFDFRLTWCELWRTRLRNRRFDWLLTSGRWGSNEFQLKLRGLKWKNDRSKHATFAAVEETVGEEQLQAKVEWNVTNWMRLISVSNWNWVEMFERLIAPFNYHYDFPSKSSIVSFAYHIYWM